MERLLTEDVGAALDGLTIPQICEKRSKMHFGEKTGGCYQMLDSAYQIIQAGNYRCPDSFKEILRQYQEEDFRLDYDIAGSIPLMISSKKRQLSSRCAIWWKTSTPTRYLETLLPKWNAAIQEPDSVYGAALAEGLLCPQFEECQGAHGGHHLGCHAL